MIKSSKKLFLLIFVFFSGFAGLVFAEEQDFSRGTLAAGDESEAAGDFDSGDFDVGLMADLDADFEPDFFLDVEPLFGLKNGLVDEYVFLKNSAYSSDKLSELNWDIKNEFFAGANFKAVYKCLFLKTGFKAGLSAISSKSGLMKDSDWRNLEAEDAGNYQYKTNYSESDNHIDYDFSTFIEAGGRFKFFREKNVRVNLCPFLGFEYQIFKFTATDGTAWYGNILSEGYQAEWNDISNRKVETFSGDVISYKRQNFILWLGGNLEFELPYNFVLGAGIKVSPWIYSESVDNHWLRSMDFLDAVSGFFSIMDISFSAEYKFTPKTSICLNADWLCSRLLRGDNYNKSHSADIWGKSPDADGGAAQKYLNFYISFRYRFLD